MKLQTPKKLWILSAFSLVCFALFLGFCLYFAGRGAYRGAFLPEHLSFSVYSGVSGEEILSTKASEPLAKGKQVLLLKNKENEPIRFSLYQNGEKLAELTVPAKREKEFEVNSDGSRISALVQEDGRSICYLSDVKSFHKVTSEMPSGGDLVFLANVELGTAALKNSFRLFGNFSFKELSLESDEKDNVVLYPDQSFRGILYVSAPNARLYFRNYSHPAPKKELNFYLKAKSLNGSALSPAVFPVTSFSQLERLADPELLPRLSDGATVLICDTITVQKSLNFSALAKLEILSPVDFCGNTLTFTSAKEGTYEVKTSFGAGIDALSLVFDSPRSALLWSGEGTVPAISTVAKRSNVKTYNGAPLPLGGEGKAVPSLVLYGKDGNLPGETEFQADGNLLVATLPYLISENSLNEASFALSCENGTASLQGDLSDGVIVTTDSEGKERRFAIEVRRDPNRIPVVHLETEGGAEIASKTQYVSATFAFDGSSTEYDSLSETHIRIRGRGNSTWKWDKKPYKIHFDEPTSLLGLPAAEEWALLSNYADKSLMRNRLAQVMASKLSFEYCPTQVCVDVFLNGEYLGVYTLGEHLEAGEGRVEVEYDMAGTDCGYFLEAGGVVAGVDVRGMNYFHAGLVNFVLIKMPEYNQLTSEQFEYIHQYMLRADEAVKKGEGYEEYLDVDSVIDWLIMIELSCNTDCTWRRSTYFTKDPGGKLVMGPMWDFDLAFGNFSKDNPGDDTWVSSEPDDDYVGETWTTHLLEDPEFRSRFKARWLEVRDTLVNTAMEEIERQYALNSPSAELNFKRWDILGKKVAFERHDTTKYRTYSSQIYYLEDFITNRADWLSEQVAEW